MPTAPAPRPSIRVASIEHAIAEAHAELVNANHAILEHRDRVNGGYVRAALGRAIDRLRWAEELAEHIEREQERQRRVATPLFNHQRG